MKNTFNELPCVVVRGVVPLPDCEFRIEVGRQMSVEAILAAEKDFGSYVVIVPQADQNKEEIVVEDIKKIGVLAKINIKVKLANNNYKVKFTLIKRVGITAVEAKQYYFVSFDEIASIDEPNDAREVMLSKIDGIMKENKNLLEEYTDIKKKYVDSVEKFIDRLANIVCIDEKSKHRYLEEIDINNRIRYILEDISRADMIKELENKINSEVRKSIDDAQKEYYLREKIKVIQNELGDKVKREEEIEGLREKIKNAKMPAYIQEKATQELNRLQSTPSVMAEASIIKTYLDFVVDLPWYKSSVDCTDLNFVQKKLDEHHYGLADIKDRIIEYLAVKIKTGRNPQTILCFAGPPGVGKTSLAISIAEALGRKFVKQSLGGVKDESEIRGHRRTYIGALPGRILKGMKDAGTINPVFLLDEIDKMSSDYKGDPASAMLEVLDPEQNARYSDHYLEEPYDLSQVLFITTANYLENVPAPLRDRMEIIELYSYTEHEKFNIAKIHLVGKQLLTHGITEKEFQITDEAIYFLIRHYTREAGVRELSRHIGSLIRKTIKKILSGELVEVIIDSKKIVELLGKPKYTHNIADTKEQIGVATGLAYTSFGGDTLPVEVTYYPGKGGIVLTGKLGDVMKESAMTALSFVKSKAVEYQINSEIFEKNDFHIHVPEGAIPKDGPSAGITIATAIYSAITHKYVRKEVGMTGEITLRGYVLPIGGLREKAIAALRSGLKTIIIPKENEKDIDEIPKEVTSELKIILAENVADVILNAVRN